MAWGAHMNGKKVQGFWTPEDQLKHINVLELKAIYMELSPLCKEYRDFHVLICSDNKTTVAYHISTRWGDMHSHQCNDIARDAQLWAKQRKLWLSAVHIPGSDNVEADVLSREFNDNLEWSLSQLAFDSICNNIKVGHPDIDLFASCLNQKLQNYVSFTFTLILKPYI